MSYMRGKYYTWLDGNGIIYLPVEMPLEVFDELVAMRWTELSLQERKAAKERAVGKHSGNVGCEALCGELGQPGFLEILGTLAKEKKE
jgi:hypothetical protein